MIKRKAVLFILVVFFMTNSCSWGIGLPVAKITITAIDENGQPVEGAKVGIGFSRNTGGGTKEIPVIGLSAIDGSFSGSALALESVGFRIEKDGYYQSFGTYRFTKNVSGKWQPWNPEIKVVMRKIEKPVPMYARDLKMTHPDVVIPSVDKGIGFDLMEGDWVAPYGTGKHADFIFRLEKTIIDSNNYDSNLTITFPNKFDGIQVIEDSRKGGSLFKLPRYAPEEGYQNKLERYMNRHGAGAPETDLRDDNNYIFRIRSEEKDGKLIRAMYGKIQGDLQFYPGGSKTASLGFKYFLNPDYTRNLEYGDNLFKNLKSTEQVSADN